MCSSSYCQRWHFPLEKAPHFSCLISYRLIALVQCYWRNKSGNLLFVGSLISLMPVSDNYVNNQPRNFSKNQVHFFAVKQEVRRRSIINFLLINPTFPYLVKPVNKEILTVSDLATKWC